MATKDQMDFFKDTYFDEEKRYEQLTRRGEIYFSIISILLSGILLKLKDIADLYKEMQRCFRIIGFAFFVLAFLFLGIAFLYLAQALRIRSYQAIIDFKKFRDDLEDTPPSDEDFFDDRIVNYMYATEKNEAVNEKRANALSRSLIFILLGFLFVCSFVVSIIFQKI
jgi:hypothetical protein